MAGRGPGGSGADPESRPEPLVGLNGQVVVRVVADDARPGEVGPGGRGLVVLVRGPAIQPADEKGRTLLGSRTAPLPDTQDRTNLLWICLTCPRREYGVGSVGYIHRRLVVRQVARPDAVEAAHPAFQPAVVGVHVRDVEGALATRTPAARLTGSWCSPLSAAK